MAARRRKTRKTLQASQPRIVTCPPRRNKAQIYLHTVAAVCDRRHFSRKNRVTITSDNSDNNRLEIQHNILYVAR